MSPLQQKSAPPVIAPFQQPPPLPTGWNLDDPLLYLKSSEAEEMTQLAQEIGQKLKEFLMLKEKIYSIQKTSP